MSKTEATHKSKCGKYLYKVTEREPFAPWDTPPYKDIEFWDTHCNKWRPSIMSERELVAIT